MTQVRPHILLCLLGVLLISVSTLPPPLAKAGNSKLQIALLPPPIAQAIGGMTATLDISGVQDTIPMTINLDGTVTATVPDVPVGEHTLTITYRSPRNVILAIATGEAVVEPDVNTHIALNALNTSMDDDGDGATNLEEVMSTTDPNNPISGGSQATLQVNIAGTGNGTVKSLGLSGITCGEICENSFIVGAEIRLIVEPEIDSMFSGWQGVDCGSEPECQVHFQDNLTVVATFVPLEAGEAPEFTLSVTKGGDGKGEVLTDVRNSSTGIRCGEHCAEFYEAGTTITLTAISAPDSIFAGWSGGECAEAETCEMTMVANQTIMATFIKEPTPHFTLAVTKGGDGKGEVTANPLGVINCGEFPDNTFPPFLNTPEEGQNSFQDDDFVSQCQFLEINCPDGEGERPFPSDFFPNDSLNQPGGLPPCDFDTEPGVPCDPSISPGFDQNDSENRPNFFSPIQNEIRKGQSPVPTTIGTDCSKLYNAGTSVTLTAIPDSDSMFAGWSGGVCVGTGICQVTMTANQTVTATFLNDPNAQFSLTVNVSGDGHGTVDATPTTEIHCERFTDTEFSDNTLQTFPFPNENEPEERQDSIPPNTEETCSGNYAAGTTVTLTAIPESDSMFAGWNISGCSGTSFSCTLTIVANQTATATFIHDSTSQLALTVNMAGDGHGTVTANPQPTGEPNCRLPDNTFSPFPNAPGEGQDSFQDDSFSSQCQFLGINCRDGDAEGPFPNNSFPSPQNEIRKSQNLAPETIGTNCSEFYDAGTTVTLTAIPDSDSIFAGWSEGECGGTGICQVTMSTNHTITATFVHEPKPQFSLTVTISGDGHGTMDAHPDTEVHCEGSRFQPNLPPQNEPQNFQSPSQPLPADLFISTASGVNLLKKWQRVRAQTIEGSCSGSFDAGTSVTLTAIADNNSIFPGWGGACAGTGQCTVTLTENKTVSVTFACVTRPCGQEDEQVFFSDETQSDPNGFPPCSPSTTPSPGVPCDPSLSPDFDAQPPQGDLPPCDFNAGPGVPCDPSLSPDFDAQGASPSNIFTP